MPEEKADTHLATPKPKPKRHMTPEMLAKLKVAREKALETKKRLKEEGDSAKIRHLQEKMDKLKPPSTKDIKKVLKEDDKVSAPSPQPESDSDDEEEEKVKVVARPSKLKKKKKKKPVIIMERSDDSESSDGGQVIYINRRAKSKEAAATAAPNSSPEPPQPVLPPQPVRLPYNPFNTRFNQPYY